MVLRLGDYGYEVKEVQGFLIENGFLKEEEPYFGIKTKEAVIALQGQLNYTESGVWDDQLKVMYEIKHPKVKTMRVRARVAKFGFSVGDIVNIVGDNAVYGGLSSDNGLRVPNSQKGDKRHTIMKVSEERGECLLREIYSWVSTEFLVKVGDSGSQVSYEAPTSIASEIKTGIGSQDERTGKIGTYTIDKIPCYTKNLVTGTTTIFDLVPEIVTDNHVANFEDQVTKSRPSPFKAYASSGPRNVSFSVVISQDYCQNGILKTVNQLQALVIPELKGSYVDSPRCLVRIGDIININAVCINVSVEWETPYKENVYHKATVTMSFDEVENNVKFAKDWEKV